MYSNELVCQIISYIDTSFLDEFHIDDLSHKLFYNRTYIMKRFKKEIGISIINYINIKKIEFSLRFFREKCSILEIALKSNFNSQEYYEEMFKKIIGVKPLVYKKYIKNVFLFDDKEKKVIQDNINKINNINNLISNYMSNRKTIKMAKKLSLFR